MGTAFRLLCKRRFIGGVRADPSRLTVMGYSMGGQAAWDLAHLHGRALAAVVPFACACVWPEDASERLEEFKANLMLLPLRQYSGEEDWYAYSWPDFKWISGFRH